MDQDSVGGRFLVRGGETHTAEGEEETRRMVVMEFPSFEVAKNCYHSDAYQKALEYSDASSKRQYIIVEGL